MSKKLTEEEFDRLVINTGTYQELYEALLPYLADEQPQQFTALGSTKPEPSRLEVAAMILASNWHIGSPQALRDADELIKQAKV